MKSTKKAKVSNGTLLKGFRKQNAVSAKDVAAKLGKSVKTIYGWEYGKNIPEASLKALKKLYGISFNTEKTVGATKITKIGKETKVPKSMRSFISYIKNSKMTPTEFGKKYDMSYGTIYRVINLKGNKHYISTDSLKKLSKDTDLNKLFA